MRKWICALLLLLVPSVLLADANAIHKFGRNDPIDMRGAKVYDSKGPLQCGGTGTSNHSLASGDVLLPNKLEVQGSGWLNSVSVGNSGPITGDGNNVLTLPPHVVLSTGAADNSDPNQNVYFGVINPNVYISNATTGSVYIGLLAGDGRTAAPSADSYEVNVGAYANCNQSAEGGSGGRGTCIGAFSKGTGNRTVCLGPNTVCGTNAVAIGRAANANFVGNTSTSASVALGYNASAQFEHATALGPSAAADSNNQLVLATNTEYVQVPGGMQESVLTQNSNTTLTLLRRTILCNATGAPVQLNLPTAASAFDSTAGHNTGTVYRVMKTDSSGNACVITAAGGDTINGAATLSLSTQYSVATIQSSGGTAWYKF